jgi:hypothetical protein
MLTPRGDFTRVVVDGASRDDTVAIARTLERVQVEWKVASPIV